MSPRVRLFVWCVALLGAAVYAFLRRAHRDDAIAAVPPPAPASTSARRYIAVQSFESEIYRQTLEGFAESVNGTVRTITLDEQKGLTEEDRLAIRVAGPSAILAVGPRALEAVRKEKPPMPVLFAALSEPPNDPGVAGVLMQARIENEIERLLEITPVERIGVVWNRSKVQSFSDALTRITNARDIELVAVDATSEAQAAHALPKLLPKVDAFVFAPDTSIHTPLYEKTALRLARELGLIVIGFNAEQCSRGALLSYQMNPREMGKQAGDLTNSVVEFGAPAEPHSRLREYDRLVNPTAARRLGLSLPERVTAFSTSCTETE